jgi:hypothetical protein
MSDTDRYDGSPMLRLLDSYVLDAIGMLDEATAASLPVAAPKLAEAFGMTGGTWQEIVEQALGFNADQRLALLEAWHDHVARSAEHGVAPNPLAFTHAVSDQISGRAAG